MTETEDDDDNNSSGSSCCTDIDQQQPQSTIDKVKPMRCGDKQNTGRGDVSSTTKSGDDATSAAAQSLCDELAKIRQVTGSSSTNTNMLASDGGNDTPETTTRQWLHDELGKINRADQLTEVVNACVRAHVDTVSDGATHTGELASNLMEILGRDPPALEVIFAIVPRVGDIAQNGSGAAGGDGPQPPSLIAASTMQRSMKTVPPETIVPEETEIERTATLGRSFTTRSSGRVISGASGRKSGRDVDESQPGAYAEYPTDHVEHEQDDNEEIIREEEDNQADSTSSNNEVAIPIAAYVVQDEPQYVHDSATSSPSAHEHGGRERDVGFSCYCGKGVLIGAVVVLFFCVGAIIAAVVLSTGDGSKAAQNTNPVGTVDECTLDIDCSDDKWCTGVEFCKDGKCMSGQNPCFGDHPMCDEENKVCSECFSSTDCTSADYGLFCSHAQCEGGICMAKDTGVCPPERPYCVEALEDCLECLMDNDCDNNVFCDGKEACVDGSCVPGFAPCDTNGSMFCVEEAKECVSCRKDKDCDNNSYCDGQESCVDGSCVAGESPCADDASICDESSAKCVECLQHSDCLQGFNCDAESTTCQAGGTCTSSSECSDKLFCTGEELCSDGICIGGQNPCSGTASSVCVEEEQKCVDCVDDQDCGVDRYCNTATNICQDCNQDEHCLDEIYCNGEERCQDGICVQGQDPCTGSTPFCLEEQRTCVECTKDPHCSDNTFCTGVEQCIRYSCQPGDPCPSNMPYCNEELEKCSASICNHAVGGCYTNESLQVCSDLENEGCQDIKKLRDCPVTFYCEDGAFEGEFCDSSSCWRQVGYDLVAAAVGDNFGEQIALTDDGSRFIVSARYDDTTFQNAGEVQVYSIQSNGAFTRLGDPFFGASKNEEARGYISGNGRRVALGPNLNHEKGVRIYERNSGWHLVGEPIMSESSQRFGRDVGLSSDGGMLAIGDPSYNENRGRVQIFQEKNGEWKQVGSDIVGTAVNDHLGWTISFSGDGGGVIAIGGRYDGNKIGRIEVYKFDSNEWIQLGNDIVSKVKGDSLGLRLDLAANTDLGLYVVAAGTRLSASNANGRLKMFKYDSSKNDFRQIGDIMGDKRTSAVALSTDGTRVALGSEHAKNNRGIVRIFDAIGEEWDYEWKQVGGILEGKRSTERFGAFVSFSSLGTRLLVSGRLPADSGKKGVVRIYDVAPSATADDGDCMRVSPNNGNNMCKILMKDSLNKDQSTLQVENRGGGIFYVTDKPETDPWTVRVTVKPKCKDCPLQIIAGVPDDVSCSEMLSDYRMKNDEQLTFVDVEDYPCTDFGKAIIYFLIMEWFYFG